MTTDEAKAKVIGLARNELGYHEQGSNVVKYNQDDWDDRLYGWNTEGQPWCDIFVDWLFIKCFGYKRGSEMTYQYDGCCGASCGSSASYYQTSGAYYQTPEVGDQIFFYADGCIGHTGIVETVNGSTITTIEGNYSDSVCRNTFTLGNSKIAGFGRPDWSLVEDVNSEDETTQDNTEDDAEGTVVPTPDIPEETYYTIVDEPIAVAEYEPLGVHVCRPSEYSFWVFAMQYLLKQNGYWVQADGYFASDTAKWFLKFQEDRGLEADCQCGELSWNELFKGITLRITDRGYAVRAMQYLLKAQDYFIYTDGEFGTQAYSQLSRFQEERGLDPSYRGTCNCDTWNELIKK